MQKWGMCYFNTSNNNCPKGTALSVAARDANVKKYADNISQAGIPWMYWQIIPNADPHDDYDYEVSITRCQSMHCHLHSNPKPRWVSTMQIGVL
jgi:mannan endo-1,4-beta-mannosidase